MAGRLDGKVALVVGGGSGMGRAGAAAMAAEGAEVVVADIALDARREWRRPSSIGGRRRPAMHVDVTSAELVERLVAGPSSASAASTPSTTARPTSTSSTRRTAG